MSRKSESEKALVVLRKILAANPQVSGVAPRDRKAALEFAVSLVEARMYDAQSEED
jgi:hypothetical protein